MCILERSILETVLVLEQEMAVQLQRLLRLVRDHELSSEGGDDDEEEEKSFFHLTRDSACCLGDIDVVLISGNADSSRSI
ncbi:hypothetical protein DVH24_000994 [Malus domestica]|uniref:Uncharacterized protein n=1 Tax=Malus domestica TaxID=3750 RepID=A0A498JXY4_MALDO|nr:hypothetical protein DVH24_000994 [Malus domestica]